MVDVFLQHRQVTKRPLGKTGSNALTRLKDEHGLEPASTLTAPFWRKHVLKRMADGATSQTAVGDLAYAASVLAHGKSAKAWWPTPAGLRPHGRTSQRKACGPAPGAANKSAIPGLERDPALASSLTYVAQGMVDDSALGRVPGIQRQLFNEQLALGSIVGVGATWRKSGHGIRVAPTSSSCVSLHRGSVAGIVVGSKEFFDLAIKDDAAASVLASLLRDAVRVALDDVFVGTAAAVADQQPAGIGYAAQTVAATGATVAAIALDVRTMVSTMVDCGVSLRSGFWIMSAEAFSVFVSVGIENPRSERDSPVGRGSRKGN